MKSRTSGSNEVEWPTFPVGPVLQHYGGDLPMEDRGWHAIRCPFHGDRQASASVNTITQVFNCHACEYGGNAVQLIMKEDGIDYQSAVARAAEITGESHDQLRGSRGSRSSVSSRERNREGGSRFRRSWRSD